MTSTFKVHNEYAAELGDLFDAVPKAVLAAIAVSALTFGGDYLSEAQARLVTEWDTLFAAGIVPQKVPSKFRHLVDDDLML